MGGSRKREATPEYANKASCNKMREGWHQQRCSTYRETPSEKNSCPYPSENTAHTGARMTTATARADERFQGKLKGRYVGECQRRAFPDYPHQQSESSDSAR